MPRRRSEGELLERRKGNWRHRWGALTVVGVLVAPASAGGAQAPAIAATLSCPVRSGSGRLVCELAVEVRAEATRNGSESRPILRWADALVVRAPDFARPLRSRVSAKLPEEGAARASIAIPLYATSENTGTLEVRARAVLCEGNERCRTASRLVTTAVAVKRAPAEPDPNPRP